MCMCHNITISCVCCYNQQPLPTLHFNRVCPSQPCSQHFIACLQIHIIIATLYVGDRTYTCTCSRIGCSTSQALNPPACSNVYYIQASFCSPPAVPNSAITSHNLLHTCYRSIEVLCEKGRPCKHEKVMVW